MYHLQGVCKYTSDTCAFAHSMEDMHQLRGGRKRPVAVSHQAAVASTVDQHVVRHTQQTERAWPKLQEPMFVEPVHLGLKDNFIDGLPVNTMKVGLAHHTSGCDGMLPSPLEHPGAHFAATTKELSRTIEHLAAAVAYNSHALARAPVTALAANTKGLDQLCTDISGAALVGPKVDPTGLAWRNFYSMPNPFVGPSHGGTLDAPLFAPPPGLVRPVQ